MLDAVRSGIGIALMPKFICSEALRGGKLRQILRDFSSVATPVHALYPTTRHLSPKVLAFVDLLREKLRLGAGSVVDLLTIEDRLTNARNAYVEAGLNFAALLARLRFSTGTLIEPHRLAQTVDRQIFYRPPWEDPAR